MSSGPSPPSLSAALLAALAVAAAVPAVGAPAGDREAGGRPLEAPSPPARAAEDTLPPDSLPADSLAPARRDTAPEAGERAPARPDTVPPEAVAPDTAVADTAAADTAGVDVGERREALAGGDFPARDSLFSRLTGLGGYRVVEYRGREVELQIERQVIRLRREAQANYSRSALRADSIIYQGAARFMEARGAIELVASQQDPVTSDSVLYYDVSRRRGTIMDARTQFAARGANWQLAGDAVPVGRDTMFMERGWFSSCNLDRPHYRFRAGQAKLVSQNVIIAWPVVLQLGNVPVAWLPFIAQDIRPGRRSGILPPRFGVDDVVRTSPGLRRHVQDFGYYLAINRFMDAQATVDWFSGRYTRLNGRFRYNFMKEFMQGNVSAQQSFGNGGRSLRFAWNHSQELSPETRLTVNGQFVQDTRLFQDRSFDPQDQTRTIESDVGFQHQLPWANLSVSGSRRQFMGEEGRVTATLPSVNLNFSPTTLFKAPRNRAGPFNNITWSGATSFSRRTETSDVGVDRLTRRASVSNDFRVKDFSLSASASLDNRSVNPVDTLLTGGFRRSRLGEETIELLPGSGGQLVGDLLEGESLFRTAVDWQSSVDYQTDLVGSTTLSPSASVDGILFASNATGGDLVSGPVRANVGTSLRTDLYGFFPGFGPFTRIRHKLSPSLDWRYSPEASVSDRVRQIPGFPSGGQGRERHTLRVSLSQTFEAKVKTGGGRRAPPGDTGARRDTAPGGAATRAAVREATGEAAPPADTAAGADTVPAGGAGEGRDRGGRAGGRERTRKVTLLSIRSSALNFDFTNRGTDEPVLTTERITNNLSSDLLEGLSLNVTHDLFAEEDGERSFDPFITRVGTSFSLRSGQGLSGLVGLGRGGRGGRAQRRQQQRTREQQDIFGERRPEQGPAVQGSGPWNLSLQYALSRARPGQGRRENQTVSGTLRFRPTPNWRVNWRTQYNVTTGNFGEHQLSLDRQLHRWEASFRFVKSPNGNFLFDVMIRLTDAPDLHVDYNQRTQQSGRR